MLGSNNSFIKDIILVKIVSLVFSFVYSVIITMLLSSALACAFVEGIKLKKLDILVFNFGRGRALFLFYKEGHFCFKIFIGSRSDLVYSELLVGITGALLFDIPRLYGSIRSFF